MKQCLMALIVGCFVWGCSSSDKLDSSTAEGGFKLGEKYESDERYEEALAQYAIVKNKHPYSKYAVEAKLRIADVHFKREDWAEAQGAYQVFKELHPKHPKIDYATYQLALSYFNQLPSTIDRDLSLADKAILYFDEVIASYPNSEYAPKSKEQKQKALKMLAEKEEYIAHFYFIRDMYDSALGRFEDVLQKYPGMGLDAKALKGAAISANKIKDVPKAKEYYQKLQRLYPDSDEARQAKREMGEGT